MSPVSYKAWDPTNLLQQTFGALGGASTVLARALTSAGLGIGPIPVSGVTGLGLVVDFPPDSDAARAGNGSKFNPQLDGVYLQVGSRPVSLTLQWIRKGRPDAAGNPAK